MRKFPVIAGVFASFSCIACTAFAANADNLKTITVLYTNDEHGWMEGMSPGQGAANLYQLWRDREGYTEDGAFLVLSGGDNFTGPAISTWTEGESMVDIMNAMHYDASAIGNHEFDFGLEALAQRTREANYPYLSANTYWRNTGETPVDIGILPAAVLSRNGLKIGIIGLTTTSTSWTTNPIIVKDLEFTEYERALRNAVKQLAGEQPDLLFVIAHVCMDELEALVRRVGDLGITFAGGGHCNELQAKEIEDTVVVGGGFHFTSYAVATFSYDLDRKQLVAKSFASRTNQGAGLDSGIQEIIDTWAESSSDILSEVIGWNAQEIIRDGTLEQLIIDSWLESYPTADVAISNRGGVRTDLAPGEITFSDVFNIMPFDNNIISVRLTGRVIRDALARGGRPVVAGIVNQDGRWILARTGLPLDMDADYSVLLNSFMYDGGDNFGTIRQADPDGFDTGVNYRQPFADWLRKQATTESRPLQLH